MKNTAVYRYEIPVDDEWHELKIGEILHVAARTPHFVEIWTLAVEVPLTTVELRVFGTGQPLPSGYGGAPLRYLGTALPTYAPELVWHLFRRMAGTGEPDPR